MFLLGHIVYLHSKNTKKGWNEKMLEIIVCAAWFLLGAYVFWFVSKAKTFQPLTLDELAMAWKLHKREANCNASQIHDLLVRKDDVVGFKCNCGYQWLQKRPIAQRRHLRAQNSIPQSTGEIEELPQEGMSPTPDLSIHYLNVKKV
jgi:hypothetical protein